MSDPDWATWLRDWNRTLLEGLDPGHPDRFLDEHITREILASGWLGSPGATDAQLGALESRLGVALPPSYRSFLRTSNGFLQPAVLVPRLLAAEEVDWYRTAHQDVIDAWQVGLVHAGHSVADDPEAFEHYLPRALQVSAVEHAGTAVYLLNPKVITAGGEWEAFYFAHWVPGVNRYPSFRALMEQERKNWTPPASAPLPRPSRVETWWSVLRWIFRSS